MLLTVTVVGDAVFQGDFSDTMRRVPGIASAAAGR